MADAPLSFNVGAEASLGEVVTGSAQMRGVEVQAVGDGVGTSKPSVTYVQSSGHYNRTADSVMGLDISEINQSDSMDMQMAMEGMVRGVVALQH